MFCRAQGTTKRFSEAWPKTGLSIAVTYLLYLKIKNEDPLVTQSFLRSLAIHSSSKNKALILSLWICPNA